MHGRLTWRDLQVSPGVVPAGATPDTPVEWVIPMVRAGATATPPDAAPSPALPRP